MKRENLARAYFPDADPRVAVRRSFLTQREVRLIRRFLGEP